MECGYLLVPCRHCSCCGRVGVMTRFFVSHYIFRWRTAMNDIYVASWPRLRAIEGASQRVQQDPMRFASGRIFLPGCVPPPLPRRDQSLRMIQPSS